MHILHKIIRKAQSLFANSIFASDKMQLSICKLELITIHKMQAFIRIPLVTQHVCNIQYRATRPLKML